jgi:hypothetical protein
LHKRDRSSWDVNAVATSGMSTIAHHAMLVPFQPGVVRMCGVSVTTFWLDLSHTYRETSKTYQILQRNSKASLIPYQ